MSGMRATRPGLARLLCLGLLLVAPAAWAALASLSAEERDWLRAHPVIRVVQDSGWPPVEFADPHGRPSGIVADYLTLIEARLGVTFEREIGRAHV